MRLRWLIFSLATTLIIGCQKDTIDKSSPEHLIPENTYLIMRINDFDSFRSQISNNQLLEGFSEITTLKEQLKILDVLRTPENVLMTFSKSKDNQNYHSYILPYSDSIFKIDSLSNVSQEQFKSKSKEYLQTTIDSSVYYSKKIGNFLFVTDFQSGLEADRTNTSQKNQFQDLLAVSDKTKPLSVLFTDDLLSSNWILEDSTQLKLSNQTLLHVNILQKETKINGLTRNNDTLPIALNAFENTIPQSIDLLNVASADVSFFKSLAFDSFDILKQNLSKFSSQEFQAPLFLQNCTEAAAMTLSIGQKINAFKIIDAQASIENYEGLTPVDQFRSVDVYEMENDSLFGNTFSPFFSFAETKYLSVIDDFLLISESLEAVQNTISSYQNNQVLGKNADFLKLMESMTRSSSLFIYSKGNQLNSILSQQFNSEVGFDEKDDASAAIQYVIDDGFAHVNGIIRQASSNTYKGGVLEEFSVSLDKELLTEPQFIKNHRNGEMDIAVQDINNKLYLISNEGKVYWKKSLEGKILGKISQIDIFKNGRLQMVFATKNKVYLLDRNGNDVGTFPLSFRDDITQPLSVFDYDNNKRYRLLVTQGNNLLMYNKEGKSVNGFKFRSSGPAISSQPKHFRVRGKDYIVFSQGNKIHVLSRVGKTRINVSDDLNFSDNGIYLNEDQFTTTSNSGELLQVAMNGRVKRENLQLEKNHLMTASSKTLVTFSNNILKIRDSQVELDFGNYTTPQIFYIDDKIYVSITDLQSKKVYLFDSLAKPIGSFPIYGNSTVELSNIDGDDSLELVTKGNDDSVIVYEIN